jgi:CubicO group peptidase (beta-lactamase class C family)
VAPFTPRRPVPSLLALLVPLSLLASSLSAPPAASAWEAAPTPGHPPATAPFEPSQTPGDPPATGTAGPTDPAELEAVLGGIMAAHLRDKRIAGATLSVVRDGELLLARGYGFSDVEGRVPVDPERTLFRIGSVNKLFTYTAVMQLVEEGRIDLDADVNEYLDFEIPATFPEPITVRDLLYHTPGFEEDSRGLFTDDPDGLVPMGEWLAENMPARVRPPGTFSAYSNYGTALAGHIVARVSGMDWDDYLDTRILEPLGMTSTTGRQPLPDRLEPWMSRGYALEGGGWKERDFELITGAAPAGSMSSTATDMARFMIAHLQGGTLGEARILEPETAREMHRLQFQHDPRVNGYGFGFYEKSSHGLRIIGHGGNTRWFHTDLALFPELDLGIFVSYNTSSGGELSFGPFLTAVLDHYFPVVPPRYEADDEILARVEGLTGRYRFNRASHTTFQKALELVGTLSVDAAEDGALVFGLFGPPTRWVEEEPGLFREEMGEARIAFRTDDAGRATHAFLSPAPMMALERVPWHGTPTLHFTVLAGGLLLFVGIVGAGGRRLGRRRIWGRWTGDGDSRPSAPAGDASSLVLGRRAMVVAAAAFLAFAVWAGILVSDAWALITGPMTGLRMALTLPVLGLVAVLVAGWALVQAVRKGEGGRWARLRLGTAVLVALLFVWSLNYWNLLGWRF